MASKVFIPDENVVWASGVLLSTANSNGEVEVRIVDDDLPPESVSRRISLPKYSLTELPLQNLDLPVGGLPDMIHLPFLHEASILDNLRRRFRSAYPYTYTGDICIALNPYKWLDLYSEKLREEYRKRSRRDLSPHVYSISASAFAGLANTRRNQTVLVSGESGAGKTETVKILMNHVTFIAQKSCGVNNGSTNNHSVAIIEKLLKANPLLESFGNAKTVRNDNSSRFGKFTQLEFTHQQFDESQQQERTELVGAKCVTYLLEKSRVVSQFGTERNYHVLYQLLACPAAQKRSLHLVNKTCSEFAYTNAGDTETTMIEGRSDADRFLLTTEALNVLGVSAELQQMLWEVLAGILYLGNVNLLSKEGDADACALDVGGKAVTTSEVEGMSPRSGNVTSCCQLLRLSTASFSRAITSRTIDVEGQRLPVPLTIEQGIVGRDALAKEIYARLFQWLVLVINFSTSSRTSGVGSSTSEHHGTISLLDIFGFECFAVNRFEQLCINFANEKLQQKFTEDILLTVQAEYEAEEIAWTHIEIRNNFELIDFVESSRNKSLISMLNEECMIPKGSDLSFFNKLKAAVANNPFVITNPRMKDQFTINHYAAKVTYTVTGFLERNKDTIPEDLRALMSGSSNPLLARLFSEGAYFISNSTEADEMLARGDSADIRRFLLLDRDDMADAGAGTVAPVPLKRPSFSFRVTSSSPGLDSSLDSCSGSNPMRPLSSAGRRSSFMVAETVTTKFKSQLNKLMETISTTQVHYIRCLKPNTTKSSEEFNRRLVVEQLRSAGIIAAVHISRAAYPARMPYRDFLWHFRVLRPDFWHKDVLASQERRGIRDSARKLQDHAKCLVGTIINYVYPQIAPLRDDQTGDDLVPHIEYYQFGKSKVFFAAGILEKLEVARTEMLLELVTCLQTRARAFICRHRFVKLKLAAAFVQPVVRGYLFRRIYKLVRRACIVIQSFIRMFNSMQLVQRLRHVKALREAATIVIQAWVRRFSVRCTFLALLQRRWEGQVAIACRVRIWRSRRILNGLKRERDEQRLRKQRQRQREQEEQAERQRQLELLQQQQEREAQEQAQKDRVHRDILENQRLERERKQQELERERELQRLRTEETEKAKQIERDKEQGAKGSESRLEQLKQQQVSSVGTKTTQNELPRGGSVGNHNPQLIVEVDSPTLLQRGKSSSSGTGSGSSGSGNSANSRSTLMITAPEEEGESDAILTSILAASNKDAQLQMPIVGSTGLLSPRSSTNAFNDNMQIQSLYTKISILEQALLTSREKEDRAREQSFALNRRLQEREDELAQARSELGDAQARAHALAQKLETTKSKLMAQITTAEGLSEQVNELQRETGALAAEKRSLQTELDNKASDLLALRGALRQSQLRLTERIEEVQQPDNKSLFKLFSGGTSSEKKKTHTERMVELETELMTALTKIHLLEEELTREKQSNILLTQFKDDMVKSMGKREQLANGQQLQLLEPPPMYQQVNVHSHDGSESRNGLQRSFSVSTHNSNATTPTPRGQQPVPSTPGSHGGRQALQSNSDDANNATHNKQSRVDMLTIATTRSSAGSTYPAPHTPRGDGLKASSMDAVMGTPASQRNNAMTPRASYSGGPAPAYPHTPVGNDGRPTTMHPLTPGSSFQISSVSTGSVTQNDSKPPPPQYEFTRTNSNRNLINQNQNHNPPDYHSSVRVSRTPSEDSHNSHEGSQKLVRHASGNVDYGAVYDRDRQHQEQQQQHHQMDDNSPIVITRRHSHSHAQLAAESPYYSQNPQQQQRNTTTPGRPGPMRRPSNPSMPIPPQQGVSQQQQGQGQQQGHGQPAARRNSFRSMSPTPINTTVNMPKDDSFITPPPHQQQQQSHGQAQSQKTKVNTSPRFVDVNPMTFQRRSISNPRPPTASGSDGSNGSSSNNLLNSINAAKRARDELEKSEQSQVNQTQQAQQAQQARTQQQQQQQQQQMAGLELGISSKQASPQANQLPAPASHPQHQQHGSVLPQPRAPVAGARSAIHAVKEKEQLLQSFTDPLGDGHFDEIPSARSTARLSDNGIVDNPSSSFELNQHPQQYQSSRRQQQRVELDMGTFCHVLDTLPGVRTRLFLKQVDSVLEKVAFLKRTLQGDNDEEDVSFELELTSSSTPPSGSGAEPKKLKFLGSDIRYAKSGIGRKSAMLITESVDVCLHLFLHGKGELNMALDSERERDLAVQMFMNIVNNNNNGGDDDDANSVASSNYDRSHAMPGAGSAHSHQPNLNQHHPGQGHGQQGPGQGQGQRAAPLPPPPMAQNSPQRLAQPVPVSSSRRASASAQRTTPPPLMHPSQGTASPGPQSASLNYPQHETSPSVRNNAPQQPQSHPQLLPPTSSASNSSRPPVGSAGGSNGRSMPPPMPGSSMGSAFTNNSPVERRPRAQSLQGHAPTQLSPAAEQSPQQAQSQQPQSQQGWVLKEERSKGPGNQGSGTPSRPTWSKKYACIDVAGRCIRFASSQAAVAFPSRVDSTFRLRPSMRCTRGQRERDAPDALLVEVFDNGVGGEDGDDDKTDAGTLVLRLQVNSEELQMLWIDAINEAITAMGVL